MVYHSNEKFVSVISMTVVVLTVTLWLFSTSHAYEELIDRQAGTRVSALPVSLSAGKQVRIKVWFSAHSGELNHNLLNTSTLVDDRGKEYNPISSKTVKSGENRYAGELVFPAINNDVKMIKLLIPAEGKAKRHVFKWALQ